MRFELKQLINGLRASKIAVPANRQSTAVARAAIETLETRRLLASVAATSPYNGQQQIGVANNITVRFNEDMAVPTLTASTLQLRDANGNVLPAAVTYDAATKTATLDPQADLASTSAYYSVQVVGGAAGVADSFGVGLTNDFNFSFTTGTPQYTEKTVFAGLINPTAIQFAPDGRVFVAEKRGVIKVFDNVADTTPTIFADLRTEVHNYWDRGLLGLAIDPKFTTGRPYIYVLYTFDGDIGGVAPKWGTPNTDSDPGASDGSSTVSCRLSKLTASGDVMTNEQVLISDWADQFPSHSIGDLEFGPDGYLYASGGDGASFNGVDDGNYGNPFNDPALEGGALRAQDVRTQGDPTALNGSVIRIDPDTGAGAPGNPFADYTDANAQRIIAYGLRNPYRMTFQPGTGRLYVADTGWNTYEELDRIADVSSTTATNFGWPAYEGPYKQVGYEGWNLPLLESLYAEGSATSPWFSYAHADQVVPGSAEPTGGSSPTGLAFYEGSTYAGAYKDALFFCDYSRRQIYVMYRGVDGQPDASTRQVFRSLPSGAGVVDLSVGPDGNLYYVDLSLGRVVRIEYTPPGAATVPVVTGDGLQGTYFDNKDFTGTSYTRVDPLVNFGWAATTSPAPGINPLTYSIRWTGQIQAIEDGTYSLGITADDGVRMWIDGQLVIDKWADQAPTRFTANVTFSAGQKRDIRIEYYQNTQGATAKLDWLRPGKTTRETVPTSQLYSVDSTAVGSPPNAVIDTPVATSHWRVGDTFSFSGGASNAIGALPASALVWQLVLIHGNLIDPTSTHEHLIQTFTGVASGTFVAPDHEYPSWLELRLTATDPNGLTTTVVRRIDPMTTTITVNSNVPGALLTFDNDSATTSTTHTWIVGATASIVAADTVTVNGQVYNFTGWSDGGPRTHDITAPQADTTYLATYTSAAPPVDPGTSVFIDSGGGAAGNFVADNFFTGGSVYSSTAKIDTSAVSNPAPQAVYQTERFGNFKYTLANLTVGKQYNVTLDFAELYWAAAGKRVFNVTGNAAAWLTNFDIYAAAGAKNKAISRTFIATADTAGKITLVFTGVKDYAKISGIECVPVSTAPPVIPVAAPVLINAGGAATGSFAADGSFVGGSIYKSTAAINTSAVANAAPAAVYQTERFGNFTYSIANLVAGAQYSVQLDFAELYWSAAGQRLFNVTGNGQSWLSNYDVYAAAGGKNKAVATTFTATADANGKIAIVFTGVKDNAKVSAIRLIPMT